MNDSDAFFLRPDALIFLIFSYLPFRDAVCTSVLSRRWRNLWHHATNIDFDRKLFRNTNTFINFINQWMDNFNQPNIQTFRLSISNPPPPHVRQCIAFAAARLGIKALHLDFSDNNWDGNDLEEPIPEISMRDFAVTVDAHRSSVESLELSASGFSFPRGGTFSALRDVSLGWMEFSGSDLDKFVRSCPELEVLILKRCWSVGSWDIYGKKIRILVIEKCSGPEYVSVTAPVLEFYSYSGACVYLQLMEYSTRMEKAVFDFGDDRQWGGEDDGEILYNLLTEMSCVKYLTICSYMLQVLPLAEEGVKLGCVTHLHLKTRLAGQEYFGITYFLKGCPMLEVLTLDLGTRRIFEGYRGGHRVEEHPFLSNLWYPTCLDRTLKTVQVIGFKGEENEMLVLKYLAKYGKKLDAIQIVLSSEIDMQAEYRQRAQSLTQFEFKSLSCRISVATA